MGIIDIEVRNELIEGHFHISLCNLKKKLEQN